MWPGAVGNAVWLEYPVRDASAQVCIGPVAVQVGLGRSRLHQCGECVRQLVERAAHDFHGTRLGQIGG